jgi:hypothetical protein
MEKVSCSGQINDYMNKVLLILRHLYLLPSHNEEGNSAQLKQPFKIMHGSPIYKELSQWGSLWNTFELWDMLYELQLQPEVDDAQIWR